MRLSSLSLLSLALVATAQSVPDNVRRVAYPQENFSLAIPATWTEIEPTVLPVTIRHAAPNTPEIKIRHGFKASAAAVLSYPWISVIITANTPVLDGLNGTDYQAIVRRVEAGDFTLDFRALRLACMESPQCEPRGTKGDLAAINQAEREHQSEKVVEIAERLIRKGFANIEAHADCVKAYEAIHDAAKSKFHLDVATALLRSILLSGDGATRETAYEVISDREEYLTLVAKGLPYVGSGGSASAIEEGGHRYDRWNVLDPKTGKTVVIFFNTDAFSSKSRVGDN